MAVCADTTETLSKYGEEGSCTAHPVSRAVLLLTAHPVAGCACVLAHLRGVAVAHPRAAARRTARRPAPPWRALGSCQRASVVRARRWPWCWGLEGSEASRSTHADIVECLLHTLGSLFAVKNARSLCPAQRFILSACAHTAPSPTHPVPPPPSAGADYLIPIEALVDLRPSSVTSPAVLSAAVHELSPAAAAPAADGASRPPQVRQLSPPALPPSHLMQEPAASGSYPLATPNSKKGLQARGSPPISFPSAPGLRAQNDIHWRMEACELPLAPLPFPLPSFCDAELLPVCPHRPAAVPRVQTTMCHHPRRLRLRPHPHRAVPRLFWHPPRPHRPRLPPSLRRARCRGTGAALRQLRRVTGPRRRGAQRSGQPSRRKPRREPTRNA